MQSFCRYIPRYSVRPTCPPKLAGTGRTPGYSRSSAEASEAGAPDHRQDRAAVPEPRQHPKI